MQFTAHTDAIEVDGYLGLLVGTHAGAVFLALQLSIHLHLS